MIIIASTIYARTMAVCGVVKTGIFLIRKPRIFKHEFISLKTITFRLHTRNRYQVNWFMFKEKSGFLLLYCKIHYLRVFCEIY